MEGKRLGCRSPCLLVPADGSPWWGNGHFSGSASSGPLKHDCSCIAICKFWLQDPLTSAWQQLLENPPVWFSADPDSWLYLPETTSRFRLTWFGMGGLRGGLSQCAENGQCPRCFLGVIKIPEVKPVGHSWCSILVFCPPLSSALNPLRPRNDVGFFWLFFF